VTGSSGLAAKEISTVKPLEIFGEVCLSESRKAREIREITGWVDRMTKLHDFFVGMASLNISLNQNPEILSCLPSDPSLLFKAASDRFAPGALSESE
jgi:hypothetical protein